MSVTGHTKPRLIPAGVEAAYDVIELWEGHLNALAEIDRLREFEQRYYDLLNQSVKRGQEDCANWVRLLMSDRIRIEPLSKTDALPNDLGVTP